MSEESSASLTIDQFCAGEISHAASITDSRGQETRHAVNLPASDLSADVRDEVAGCVAAHLREPDQIVKRVTG
jgi:hypothetical protein